MVEAAVDKTANVLRVRHSGDVNGEEMRRGADDLVALLPDLKPGFRLLADLSALETMGLDCVAHLNRMMDLCNGAGVDLVVRVVPDPQKDIGLNIMSLFHYGRGVRIVTCQTAEEGERLLAG